MIHLGLDILDGMNLEMVEDTFIHPQEHHNKHHYAHELEALNKNRQTQFKVQTIIMISKSLFSNPAKELEATFQVGCKGLQAEWLKEIMKC